MSEKTLQEQLREALLREGELKLQNKALQLSHQELTAALERHANSYDLSRTAYLTLGYDGSITDINRSAAALMGIDCAQIVKRDFSAFLLPEDLLSWQQQLTSIQQHNAKCNFNVRLVRPDGSVISVHINSLFMVQNGRAPLIRLALTQASPRTVDSSFTGDKVPEPLIQTYFDGYYEVNAHNGKFLLLNNAYSNLVGFSREELLHMTIRDLDAVETADETAARLLQIRETGYERFEACHRHKDGHLINLEADVRYSNLNGGIFFVLVRDISVRKQAEKNIQEARLQLKLFIGQAPVGIAMMDNNMTYLAASGRWTLEHGQGYQDLRGLNHYLVHPDLPDKWKEVHRRALLGETIENDGDSWVRANGSITYLKWVVRPWLNEQAEIGGIIIFTEDITARTLLEIAALQHRSELEALQRKNIALQTAAAFAYELNQPLMESYSDAALTLREKEVLALAIAGHSSKEIGLRLGISFRTVETHRANVMKKTGAANMLELAQLLSN